MKGIEFLDDFNLGQYRGRAARLGVGLEAWEAYNAMNANGNTTVVVSGAQTLSILGGWSQGGGHNNLVSLYGLGADQPLAFNLVTADGRFITADATQNSDIYFALRGGGGSKFLAMSSHPEKQS